MSPWEGSPGSEKLAAALGRAQMGGGGGRSSMRMSTALPLWISCSTYTLSWSQPLPSHLYDFLDHSDRLIGAPKVRPAAEWEVRWRVVGGSASSLEWHWWLPGEEKVAVHKVWFVLDMSHEHKRRECSLQWDVVPHLTRPLKLRVDAALVYDWWRFGQSHLREARMVVARVSSELASGGRATFLDATCGSGYLRARATLFSDAHQVTILTVLTVLSTLTVLTIQLA